MEKGIDKAAERALEKYPLMADDDKEGLEALKYIGMECECASVFNEAQEAKQAYFIEGYHQAEKDVALTWQDISYIVKTYSKMEYDKNYKWVSFSEACKETLNRFNKQKGK